MADLPVPGPLLVIRSGTNEGEQVALDRDSFVIGRHLECDFRMQSDQVSRQHARIQSIGNRRLLEDLGSTNGTFLNGNLINVPTELRIGDEIRIADVVIEFVSSESADRPLSPVHTETVKLRGEAAKRPAPFRDYREDPQAFDLRIEELSSVIDLIPFSDLDTSKEYALRLRDEVEPVRSMAYNKEFYRADANQSTTLTTLARNALFFCEGVSPENIDSVLINILREFVVGPNLLASGMLLITDVPNSSWPEPTAIGVPILEELPISTSKLVQSYAARKAFSFDQTPLGERAIYGGWIYAPLLNFNYEVKGMIVCGAVPNQDIQDTVASVTFEQDDLERMLWVGTQLWHAIEHAPNQRATAPKSVDYGEIRAARMLQREYLPKSKPVIPGHEFGDAYLMGDFASGDHFDYVMMPDGRLVIVSVDVAGTGFQVVVLMAKLSSELKYCLLQSSTLADAVNELNRAFPFDTWSNCLVRIFLATLEPSTDDLVWLNAGHESAVLSSGSEFIDLASSGLPLGVAEDAYQEQHVQFRPGDRLVIFSDGYRSVISRDGEPYSLDLLRNQIAENGELDPQSLVDSIRKDVRDFAVGPSVHDDFCVICVQRE